MFSYPITIAGVPSRVLQSGLCGPAVVLVHGLASRADRWKHNLDALGAAGMRAFAVDLPGHGHARKGADFDYSAAGYSRWVAAFMDAVEIDRAVVVGTSFGGLVAAAFALNYRERIRSLVAVGSIGLLPMGEARRRRTIDWLPDMTRDGIRGRLGLSVVDRSLVTDEWVEEDFRINTSPGAAEAFARLADYYRTTIDEDAACDRLARLTGTLPTQLIWGESDISVATAIGIEAHARLPGSRFDLVPNAAHLPYFEQPEQFNRLLLDFIQSE